MSQGDTEAKLAGTGALHMKPSTASTIGGTQIQCRSLLVGFWWLAPYSVSQSVTLRMQATLPRAAGAGQIPGAAGGPAHPCDLSGGHHAAQLP